MKTCSHHPSFLPPQARRHAFSSNVAHILEKLNGQIIDQKSGMCPLVLQPEV